MELRICDSLPVNYSHSDPTGNNIRRTCTTQSSDNYGDYPSPEDFYTHSPSLRSAETAQSAPQPSSSFPTAINTAPQTYSLPPQSPGSSEVMWPTPPATSCDDFEDYSYTIHLSTTAADFSDPGAGSSAGSAIGSPRSWSSPEVPHLTYEQAVWRDHEPTPPPYSMLTSMPAEESYHHHVLNLPYPSPAFTSNMDRDYMGMEAPGMTPDYAESAISDASGSPLPTGDHDSTRIFGDEDAAAPSPSQDDDALHGDDTTKIDDQPYAQLLYKAFMSREEHAMTLQEIYQWFRENTERANTEHKGWQNSIRHNLSMNAAFIKRDQKREPGSEPSTTGEPKKSTEWILEDWAVRRGGVMSTTHYRSKGKPSRRGGSASYRASNNRHLSARASSGRKGGIVASRTRSAANRAALRRQQYGDFMVPRIPGSSYQSDHAFYSRHPSMDFSGSPRGDVITPLDVPAGAAILFPESMQGHPSFRPTAGQEYYFGAGQLQHRHPHQSHPSPTVYRLEDATSVYQPLPTSQPMGTDGHSDPTRHIPAAFSNLFTHDDGENTSNSSIHVGTLHYGWGNGRQFTP